MGTALGKKQAAENLITDTHRHLAKIAQEHPEFSGKTVAVAVNTSGSQLSEIPITDARYSLLTELGFAASPTSPRDSTSFNVTRSMENLPDINADVLVIWHLSDQAQRALETRPTFGRIPAVASGGYVPITEPLMGLAISTSTILSIPWALDNGYGDELADALSRQFRG